MIQKFIYIPLLKQQSPPWYKLRISCQPQKGQYCEKDNIYNLCESVSIVDKRLRLVNTVEFLFNESNYRVKMQNLVDIIYLHGPRDLYSASITNRASLYWLGPFFRNSDLLNDTN